MDDKISKETGKRVCSKGFRRSYIYMQQGSLGHDVISLLVFGGTVFVSQIQTAAIYMYVLVQFD